MDEMSFWTYPLVFLTVFASYLMVSGALSVPRALRGPGWERLPLFYRLFHRYFEAAAFGIGATLEQGDPAQARRIQATILRSGLPLTAAKVLGARVVAALSGGIVACLAVFLLSGAADVAVGIGLLAAFLGWVYPTMVVEQVAQARQVEIIRSLPFAIDLIVSAMRAGLDFVAAIRYYVSLGERGALSVEFGLMLRQMELGKSRVEALSEMATHVQTDEFTAFVGSVAHGTEIGASLIDTLKIQGEDMRRARFNLAERKAARAPSIMIFPIALFILPAVGIVVLVPVLMRFKAAKGGA
ncbi:MAG: type II secretion system F family protein [Kiritimatiellia bacterium]